MKYGLPEEAIARIRDVFQSFPAVDRAILYGSRAKGGYKTGSDIDLTLEGVDLTPDSRAKIALKLDDLLLPYEIDLSLRLSLNHPELQEHINRVGLVFSERNH